ncbi:MAG: Spo0E family sporulation regulatory protein-aspartic acid phosphatase [Firmicutes bacterium]|nr:Spo0E family sporulation regulatory protein-aspartic acid phosphatase [Bacillota bacterium]
MSEYNLEYLDKQIENLRKRLYDSIKNNDTEKMESISKKLDELINNYYNLE